MVSELSGLPVMEIEGCTAKRAFCDPPNQGQLMGIHVQSRRVPSVGLRVDEYRA
jgi:hypothetical protein